MSEQRVKNYYTDQVRKEWRRLVRDAYRHLEFETTLHFLEKYLPKHGRILDAGGGPGRYTIELAKRGYQVVLLDLTPANLEFAKRQIKRARVQGNVAETVRGSIVDLSCFPSNSFDAVICLGGPLSHVLDARKRAKAISELTRVAKKGAPILVSVMSRLGLLVVVLTLFQHEIELPQFKRLRAMGDIDGTTGFTPCHFFLPEELRETFSTKRLKILEMVGLEGLGSHHRKEINHLAKNPNRWKTWLETHFQNCTHPTVVGISEHILIVSRKTNT
jgi:ubiquinone/menaquinone biosynthesis C-methylase UbiE